MAARNAPKLPPQDTLAAAGPVAATSAATTRRSLVQDGKEDMGTIRLVAAFETASLAERRQPATRGAQRRLCGREALPQAADVCDTGDVPRMYDEELTFVEWMLTLR
jgi:hypothetical protein